MNTPDTQIVKFIKQHHVLNLATCAGNQAWSCSCFYAWLEKEAAFVFSSDGNTRHAAEIGLNPKVSGTIVLETKVVGKIQGIQFTGEAELANDQLFQKARNAYLLRFPYAIAMNTTFWVLYPNFIKLTDNRLGFGKKLLWERKVLSNLSLK